MELIAHRGASFDAPENSIEAFELAIARGATRIELDIQVTSDGVAVVNHDENTARTGNGNLEIQFATVQQLRRIRLANGEPIPRFEDVCRQLSGRCTLDVELKGSRPSVLDNILETLDRFSMLDDALITSFDADTLRMLRTRGYVGRTGLVVGSTSIHPRQRAYEFWPIDNWKRAQCTDLVMHHRLVHRMLRNAVRQEGGRLLVWMSMDDERKPAEKRAAAYQRINKLDVDGAIVGRINEALQHFENKASSALGL